MQAHGQAGIGMVRVQDVVDRLVALGLEREDADAYVHLCKAGPSKASDLAGALGMHRTDAYRTLQRLSQTGFVSASLTRPVRFQAADPDVVFERLLAQHESRAEAARRAREEIGEALRSLRSGVPEPGPKRNFRLIHGRQEIYRTMAEMMREAKLGLQVISTHESSAQMTDAAGIWEAAAERAAAGLSLRVVARTTPASRTKLAMLLRLPTIEIRHTDTPRTIRFVLADGGQVLLWVASDPSSRLTATDDVAVWSDAPDLVAAQSELFALMWERSRELQDLDAAKG